MMQIKINPNEKWVRDFKEILKANGGYCPCQVKRTPENKCMCRAFKDMVMNGVTGACHCGLYIAVNSADMGD